MNTYMQTDNHISDRSKPLEVVGGLFSEDYLSRFRVFNPKTLFPPTPEEFVLDISKNKCPICKRKLYLNREKTKAFCRSKVRDKFFINSKRLVELGGSLK